MKRYLNRIFSVMLGAAVLTASVPAAVPFAAYAATSEAGSEVTLNPIVIGYEVMNSNGKAISSITSSTPFRMKISIKDIKVKTSQLGENASIDFIKSMDDFKATVESVTITSSGNDLLKYDVVLKDCKWTGGDKAFGFMVGYSGANDYATGSVTITECNTPDKTEDPVVNVAEPIIKISAIEPASPIKAGETGEFKIKLKNLGATSAYNVLAEVTPSDDILIIDGTGTQDIESIDFKGEEILTIKYKALEKINAEKQNFGVSLRYYYDNGTSEVTGNASSQVAVAAEVSTVEKVYPVIVSDFSLADTTLESGKDYSAVLTVKNIGSADMDNVFVNISATDDLIITGGTGSRFFESIPVNTEKKLTVSFRTMEEFTALRQSVTASLKYTYKYGSEQPDGTYEQAFVMLGKKTAETSPLPVITSKPFENPLLAGRQYRKAIYINNKGTGDMTNITVKVKGSEGLTITKGNDQFFVEKIGAGKSKRILVNFNTLAELTSVTQSLDIEIEYYYDKAGTMTPDTKTGSVYLSSEVSTTPVLRISGERLPEALVADHDYEYTIYVKNYGDITVRDAFIDLTATDDIYFLDGTEAGFIDIIRPGKTAELKVKFRTLKKITSVKQSITAAMKYSYGRDTSVKQAESNSSITLIAAATEGADGSNTSAAPNIIIGKYDIGADQIAAGDVFTLDLDFYNTSASTSIENVVMTIGASGDLSIYGGSSSFFYQNLAAAAAANESIQLRALPTAATGTSSVTVSFKYDYVVNDTRTTMTSEQSIFIPLYQPDKLTLSVSKPTYDVYVGNEVYITLSYMNKGRADASNVKAEIVASSTSADNGTGGDIPADDGTSGGYGTAEGVVGGDDIQPVDGEMPMFSAAADNMVAVDDGMYDGGYVDGGFSDGGYSDPGYTVLSTEKVIGNIQAGGNGTVDFVVTPTMGGTISFVIKVTYEDSNMNEIVKELPVSFTAMEQQWDVPDYPMTYETTDSGEGGFPWIAVIIGGSVLVVAAVVVIIVVVHKKHKNGKKLTADDIDWEDELDDDKSDSDDKTKV